MTVASKRYLRVAEVEAEYRIKPGVLYQLIAAGKIRTIQIGTKANASRGTRLIDVASLDAFLASRATGGAS